MCKPSRSDFRSVDKDNIIGQKVPLYIFCLRVNGTTRYDLVRGMTNLGLALEGWSKIACLHQLLDDVQPSNELTLKKNDLKSCLLFSEKKYSKRVEKEVLLMNTTWIGQLSAFYLDINLGKGGPVGEGLQTLTHLLICEDVKGGEGNLRRGILRLYFKEQKEQGINRTLVSWRIGISCFEKPHFGWDGSP